MCLVTDQKEPRTAQTEIPVYKVLRREVNWDYFGPIIKMENGPAYFINTNESPYRFYSPYNSCFEYNIGSNKPHRDEWPPYEFPIDNEVGHGWLHAFTNKDNALALCKELYETQCGYNKYFIVQMTIPAGAKYYLGNSGTEICSDELVWN